MAQLFFKYGTMNSGKSLQLLATAHNYEEKGSHVLLLTAAADNRFAKNKVASRIGISEEATPFSTTTRIADLISVDNLLYDIDCILVDEAQFLSKRQVSDLAAVVDMYDVPVICFGLKTDFQGHLFSGSEKLIELADKIEEIKTVCHFCDKKATMNLRLVDGIPTYSGEQIQIGDKEYISVCRKHYSNPYNVD